MKISPGDQKLRFELGESYYESGKYALAISHFDQVIELNPNYFWAYYRKGFAHSGLRQRQPAIEAFQVFLSKAPKQYYKQILQAEAEMKKLK